MSKMWLVVSITFICSSAMQYMELYVFDGPTEIYVIKKKIL